MEAAPVGQMNEHGTQDQVRSRQIQSARFLASDDSQQVASLAVLTVVQRSGKRRPGQNVLHEPALMPWAIPVQRRRRNEARRHSDHVCLPFEFALPHGSGDGVRQFRRGVAVHGGRIRFCAVEDRLEVA